MRSVLFLHCAPANCLRCSVSPMFTLVSAILRLTWGGQGGRWNGPPPPLKRTDEGSLMVCSPLSAPPAGTLPPATLHHTFTELNKKMFKKKKKKRERETFPHLLRQPTKTLAVTDFNNKNRKMMGKNEQGQADGCVWPDMIVGSVC